MARALKITCRKDMDVSAAIERLTSLLGERLSLAEAVRIQHADDPTWNPALPPDAVAFAESEAEVAEIVRICADCRVPLIPYGAGTSLEGHIAAPCGGISLDLSRMNAILEVRPEDLDCRVQPGVTRRQLNSYLRDTGLFFPIDPGADATIGGMVSTRASGTNAVRYGTMAENVKALRVVLANGEIIHTGSRARKSASGYDLTRLFVGAEGTLGIITEITLKLHGIPETVIAGICNFPDIGAACEAVIETIQIDLPVARIELLDAATIAMVNAYSDLDLPERPTLFVEFAGTGTAIHEQIEIFTGIVQDHGGVPGTWAEREEDRRRLWRARHDVFWAAKSANPGMVAMTTDVCVPISRLAECVTETQKDMRAHDLSGAIVGHVGDGNFHVILFAPPNDDVQKERIEAFAERLVERALAMDGTATGEHGIGMGKLAYMEKEHGRALHAMRAIKQALDPLNILNPGKVLPPETSLHKG